MQKTALPPHVREERRLEMYEDAPAAGVVASQQIRNNVDGTKRVVRAAAVVGDERRRKLDYLNRINTSNLGAPSSESDQDSMHSSWSCRGFHCDHVFHHNSWLRVSRRTRSLDCTHWGRCKVTTF